MSTGSNNNNNSSSIPAVDPPVAAMNRMRLSGNNPSTSSTSSSSMYVAERFPVNSLQQITILPDQEVITGRVYCTDEITRTLILQKALTYTTLSSEIRIVSLNSIVHSQQLPEKDGAVATGASDKEPTATGEDIARATPLTQPLPVIQKKALEERERRAMRLAEESLRHINPKASPIGQAVFERLLKACGEVEWKDDTTSILVLKQIQVDAPYEPSNCTIVPNNNSSGKKNTAIPQQSRISNSNGGTGGGGGMSLEDVSLDRVKKIVAASSQIGSPNAGVVDQPNDATATTNTVTTTANSS